MGTVLTEGKHAGECVISEVGPISREKGVLTSGQSVVDGQVLAWSGGKLIAAAGTADSEGFSDEDIAGVAFGNHDATDGQIEIPYIARLAELRESAVTLHTSSENDDDANAAVVAALEAKNIILR